MVTKHGEKVEQLHLFKLDGDYQFPLVCVVKGCMHFFDENGRRDNIDDQILCMAPKKKKLWISVGKKGDDRFCSHAYRSLEMLKGNGWETDQYHIIQIEIDDE